MNNKTTKVPIARMTPTSSCDDTNQYAKGYQSVAMENSFIDFARTISLKQLMGLGGYYLVVDAFGQLLSNIWLPSLIVWQQMIDMANC